MLNIAGSYDARLEVTKETMFFPSRRFRGKRHGHCLLVHQDLWIMPTKARMSAEVFVYFRE